MKNILNITVVWGFIVILDFLLVALKIGPRALHMVGKYSFT